MTSIRRAALDATAPPAASGRARGGGIAVAAAAAVLFSASLGADARSLPHDGHAERAEAADTDTTHDPDPGADTDTKHGPDPGADTDTKHGPDPGAVPPVTASDLEAAFPDLGGMDARQMMLEDPFVTFLLLDRLEAREAAGDDTLHWELSAWAGRGLRRLWVRSEGERRGGDTERAELELLWGRGVARWWDVVAGVRRDFEPGPAETWAAFGVQGIAPYRFEVEATAYLADAGRAAARIEAEHELLITNRLILRPAVELNWHRRADPLNGIGAGLSSGEAGVRLRYEIRREVAPYVGIVREKKLGETADLARAAGRETGDTRLVAGIRLWF